MLERPEPDSSVSDADKAISGMVILFAFVGFLCAMAVISYLTWRDTRKTEASKPLDLAPLRPEPPGAVLQRAREVLNKVRPP